MDLSIFENKIYSQYGEDGITMKLIELIYDDTQKKYYVEFGVEDGKECNTRILRENYGWSGLQMDGSNENLYINLRKEFLTKENIVDLFRKYSVPTHINLLSVDIDFNDFYCLKEILKHYTCDIIICEYNASISPQHDLVIIYDKNGMWYCTNYYGASLLALNKLAEKYNYTLVYATSNGLNCFFVHNDLIKIRNLDFKNMGNVDGIYRPARYSFGPHGGHPQDPYYRQYISSEEAMQI